MFEHLHIVSAPLLQPLRLLRAYPRAELRADLIAGATVGIVLLPQALAFSLLAGLPPEMGLFSGIVAALVGALWGSSSHLNSGPTNTASLLTLSVLLPIAAPGSPEFIAAAGLVAVLSGIIRLVMGLARLGLLVNFVSDAVSVGFTAGAGMLIISNQLGPMLRLPLPPTSGLGETLQSVIAQAGATHLPSLLLGLGTIALIVILQRVARKLPTFLLGVAGAGLFAWLLGLSSQGVRVLGELPRTLPPLANLPLFNLELIGQVINGALALAIIGLVEAVAIARAVAGHSGQRLDSNQEFVGQGLANIAAGAFSGYPTSASFNRSALSYQAGGRNALTNAFSGLFVLAAMFLLAPLMAQLPRAVLAGALVLTAWSMVDIKSMLQLWRGDRADAVIMLVTLIATLLLPLQFAVLIGVLMSLGYYLLRTSAPRVQPVLPDKDFRHWEYQPQLPCCPQLGVIDVQGDLYFGAVNHVEERIYEELARNPRQRFLMLRMHSVNRCDMSGIKALEHIHRACRNRGGDLFLVRTRPPVMELMYASGFARSLGEDHFLDEDRAIDYLFHKVIDPAVCIYECEVRAFRECQNLPKRILLPADRPQFDEARFPETVATISPRSLWDALHSPDPPLVVDVRELREFQQGHIPGAVLLPLPAILALPAGLPHTRQIVLVCRSGRRSARAAATLTMQQYHELVLLEGGMLAWEAENLLEAVS